MCYNESQFENLEHDMRETLHFNTTRTIVGEGHIELRDQGTFWSATIIVFKQHGEVISKFTRTFARDVLAHQIIKALVAEYNKGDAS